MHVILNECSTDLTVLSIETSKMEAGRLRTELPCMRAELKATVVAIARVYTKKTEILNNELEMQSVEFREQKFQRDLDDYE